MTWNDPNPLANPYTARQHRQMNVFRRDPNASLPHKESSIYVDELTVPDTETYVQNGLFGQTFRNGVLDLRSYSNHGMMLINLNYISKINHCQETILNLKKKTKKDIDICCQR